MDLKKARTAITEGIKRFRNVLINDGRHHRGDRDHRDFLRCDSLVQHCFVLKYGPAERRATENIDINLMNKCLVLI